MARNETKSVIFSSEKRKNERVMIEFAILKDETDHVPVLLSLFSASKQITTFTGCYSPHGTHRLENSGRTE